LRVGALPLTLVQPLPDALARLRQRLPQVHVYLSEDTVPNLWRQMEAGEFDAIVCRLPALSEQPRLPPGIAHRTVGQESLVLVCGRRHPIARRRRPAPAELRQHDWVLPPEGSYTRFAIEQFARLARGETRQSRTGGAAGVLLIPSLRLVGLAGQANRARSDSERRAPLA